jgi:competence protein ComGC
MKYGNRPRWKQIVGSPVSLIVLLVILVALIRATWSVHEKSAASIAKLAQAQAELIKLQARDADLSRKVAYLSTNEGVQSGESVAVILDDSQTAAAVNTASTTPSVGWWGRVLQFFGL